MATPRPILTVPGYTGSGPGHWQTLWERSDPRFVRVEQRDWYAPEPEAWTGALDRAVRARGEPVLLVAHSLGCITVARWAEPGGGGVAGALLVAPADVERKDAPEPIRGFAPLPLSPLPFPSLLVSSSDDPYLAPERADRLARSWGSRLARVGAAGHLDTASGVGAWPEGLALLAELEGLAGR